jgi:hypothetical protein
VFAENDARSYSSFASNLAQKINARNERKHATASLLLARLFVFRLGVFGELLGGSKIFEQCFGVGATFFHLEANKKFKHTVPQNQIVVSRRTSKQKKTKRNLFFRCGNQLFERFGNRVRQTVAQLRVNLRPIFGLLSNHIPRRKHSS